MVRGGTLIMKNIKITGIMETSYEDGSYWVEYSVEGKLGYEIITPNEKDDFNNGDEGYYNGVFKECLERAYNTIEALNKTATEKFYNVCCGEYLSELIENCRQSDNEMWFVEYDELKEDVEDGKIKSTEELIDVVGILGLNEYIKFDEDDCAITIYGGVITKLLF